MQVSAERVMKNGFWLTIEAAERMDDMAAEVTARAQKRAKMRDARIRSRKIRRVAEAHNDRPR